MQYRPLGRSGLKISPICLGTMMFGGPTDEATSNRIVAKAIDILAKELTTTMGLCGVNTIAEIDDNVLAI